MFGLNRRFPTILRAWRCRTTPVAAVSAGDRAGPTRFARVALRPCFVSFAAQRVPELMGDGEFKKFVEPNTPLLEEGSVSTGDPHEESFLEERLSLL